MVYLKVWQPDRKLYLSSVPKPRRPWRISRYCCGSRDGIWPECGRTTMPAVSPALRVVLVWDIYLRWVLQATYPWVCGILTRKTLEEDFDVAPEDSQQLAEQAYDRYCEGNGETEYECIEAVYSVQQSDFSKNFPLNGIHPNFFASFFLLITVRLDICSSSAICATVNPL